MLYTSQRRRRALLKVNDPLLLENQLCFPLYAAAREVTKIYAPLLAEIGLTYTQYIAMMVLWERQTLTAKELGNLLFLDSGTLTPVLKRLEGKGYITRERGKDDERTLVVRITESGNALKEQAVSVPAKVVGCVHLDPDEAVTLYQLLYKILGKGEKHDDL
jgi:DNA-binding MarR family transcriptional regulator